MGVEIKCGVEVGKDITLDELRAQGYKAFYMAIGAQGGRKAGVEDEDAEGVVAILAIAINVLVITNIIKRAKKQKKNPYTNEIFTDTRDFKLALERAAEAHKDVA